MKPISFQCNHFKFSREEIVTMNPSFYIGHCPHIHQYATSNQRSYSKKRKIHFALATNSLQKIFSKSLIIAYSPLRTQVPSNKNKLLLPIGKLAPYVSVGVITGLVSRCRGYNFGKDFWRYLINVNTTWCTVALLPGHIERVVCLSCTS